MAEDYPSRIHEILESRRFPGIAVRRGSQDFEYNDRGKLPRHRKIDGGISSDRLARNIDESAQEFATEAKRQIKERKMVRKKPPLRPLGRVDIRDHIALKRHTGDEHVWRDPKKALKMMGRLVE